MITNITEKEGVKFRNTIWGDFLIFDKQKADLIEKFLFGQNEVKIECNYTLGFDDKSLDPLLKYRDKINGLKIIGININLSNLDSFRNLEFLSIGGANSKTEINFNNLQKIKVLHFGWSKNRSTFTNLKNLQELAIGDFEDNNLEFTSNFVKLESLRVGSNKLTADKGIESLVKLKSLEFYDCPNLKSLEFVKNQSIENLAFVYCNNLSNLNVLSKLKHCKSIEFYKTKSIKKYDFLSGLKELEAISFEDVNEIESLEFLNKSKKLRKLFVTGDSKIIDGKVKFLLEMNLDKLIIRKKRHYDAKI